MIVIEMCGSWCAWKGCLIWKPFIRIITLIGAEVKEKCAHKKKGISFQKSLLWKALIKISVEAVNELQVTSPAFLALRSINLNLLSG
jgi:hypothetical protein